jgi:hypothetical protein
MPPTINEEFAGVMAIDAIPAEAAVSVESALQPTYRDTRKDQINRLAQTGTFME